MKAIITGHSRGLGAALATELLACGIGVLGIARSGNTALQRRYPQLVQQAVDLSDLAALQAWLASGAIDQFVGHDTVLLINNAASAGPLGPGGSVGSRAVGAALALNAGAPMMLCEHVLGLPHVAGRQCRIMHVSSGASVSALPGWSSYCASKAALDQQARCIAAEARPGVRIASVMPGVIDTDMQSELRQQRDDFALRDMFVRMHASGALQSPQRCARRLAAWLLDERFGESPVLSLDAAGARAVDVVA